MKDNRKVGETIINVSGQNHVINFGINIKGQQNNPSMNNKGSVLGAVTSSPYRFAAIPVLGVVIGTLLVIMLAKMKSAKKHQKTINALPLVIPNMAK